MAKGMCSVEGCGRPARTRGWCQAHYMRWWYTGDVRAGDPIVPHPARTGAPCLADGCTNPQRTQGWCPAHYMRLLEWGEVRPEVPLKQYGLTPYERVMAQVEWQGRCLVFTGRRTRQGYGQVFGVRRGGKAGDVMAHRVVVEHHLGPSDLHVLHSCDNPPCVNIEHLRYGTDADNTADKMARKGHWRVKG